MSSVLDDSVRKLSGVGKVRAEAYARLHIHTVRDLLSHYPRAYENRGNITPLANAVVDGVTKNAVILTVGTYPRTHLIRRGMELLKFKAYDDSAVCEITFFNQPYLKDTFSLGSTFRFWGKIETVGNRATMSSPAYEPYAEGFDLPSFYSIYPLSEGLTQKQLTQNIAEALSASASVEDTLPEEIRHRFELCTKNYALRTIHCPTDYKSLEIAKKRLIFDELFNFALGLTLAKRTASHGTALPCTHGDIDLFKSGLPYALTNAQARTVSEICADMARDIPMTRMVVGDVGCGKTVCAAAAVFRAVSSGYRAALMVPTGILAHQHYEDLAPLFEKLGYSCALLTGAVTPAEKRKIYEKISCEPSDGIQIVIGTQALISEAVRITKLGLVITDEQHRFGVNQRSMLSGKSAGESGLRPHMLVMSATPIPRSLALVLFGDLDISKIDEMPPGRQRVDTFAVDESYRARLDAFIRKNVDAGGQVYVVCPAVEEQERADGEILLSEIGEYKLDTETQSTPKQPPLKAATVFSQELQKRLGDKYSVAFVHGKMKQDEKSAVMTDFAEGKINILVSTTVIEVGVNVPNATLMIVENAERFGLSQLHQLRGRVGRGSRKSYCILVAGAPLEGQSAEGFSLGKTAKARLEVMRTTYDGYTIAEKDLAARGPGDFLASGDGSIRQSGGFEFRLADMCADSQTLYDAFAAATDLLTNDPELNAHPRLRDDVIALFENERDIIS